MTPFDEKQLEELRRSGYNKPSTYPGNRPAPGLSERAATVRPGGGQLSAASNLQRQAATTRPSGGQYSLSGDTSGRVYTRTRPGVQNMNLAPGLSTGLALGGVAQQMFSNPYVQQGLNTAEQGIKKQFNNYETPFPRGQVYNNDPYRHSNARNNLSFPQQRDNYGTPDFIASRSARHNDVRNNLNLPQPRDSLGLGRKIGEAEIRGAESLYNRGAEFLQSANIGDKFRNSIQFEGSPLQGLTQAAYDPNPIKNGVYAPDRSGIDRFFGLPEGNPIRNAISGVTDKISSIANLGGLSIPKENSSRNGQIENDQVLGSFKPAQSTDATRSPAELAYQSFSPDKQRMVDYYMDSGATPEQAIHAVTIGLNQQQPVEQQGLPQPTQKPNQGLGEYNSTTGYPNSVQFTPEQVAELEARKQALIDKDLIQRERDYWNFQEYGILPNGNQLSEYPAQTDYYKPQELGLREKEIGLNDRRLALDEQTARTSANAPKPFKPAFDDSDLSSFAFEDPQINARVSQIPDKAWQMFMSDLAGAKDRGTFLQYIQEFANDGNIPIDAINKIINRYSYGKI